MRLVSYKPIKMAKSNKNFTIFDHTKNQSLYNVFSELHYRLYLAILRDLDIKTKTIVINAKLLKEYVKELNANEQQLHNNISKLIERRALERVERGVYKIACAGIRKGNEIAEPFSVGTAPKMIDLPSLPDESGHFL